MLESVGSGGRSRGGGKRKREGVKIKDEEKDEQSENTFFSSLFFFFFLTFVDEIFSRQRHIKKMLQSFIKRFQLFF